MAEITETEEYFESGTVHFAMQLLRLIAEDTALRPSYRVRAREHLKRLQASTKALSAHDFREAKA